MKYIVLVLVLVEAVSFAQTEWPIGENTCGGRWSYKQYPMGRAESHGVEKEECGKNEQKCGVQDVTIYKKCRHEKHGLPPWEKEKTFETNNRRIWWDHHHIDKDVDMKQHCKGIVEKMKIFDLEIAGYKFKRTVDYGVVQYKRLGRKCIRRDGVNKCQAWKYESELKCFVKKQVRNYIYRRSAHCGIEKVTQEPKECCWPILYYKKRTKDSGIPVGVIHKKSRARLEEIPDSSSDVATGGRVPGSEQCRSGDDLYVSGRPEAQKKFAYVKEVYLSIIPEVEKGAPEPVKQEFEALLHMLELLFQNHSGYYTDEQLDWILDQVTFIQTAYPELRKKPIIKIED